MGTRPDQTRPAHLGVEGGVAGEGVLEGALADAVRKVAHEAAILRAGAVLPVGVPPRRRHRRGRRSNPSHEQPNWNPGMQGARKAEAWWRRNGTRRRRHPDIGRGIGHTAPAILVLGPPRSGRSQSAFLIIFCDFGMISDRQKLRGKMESCPPLLSRAPPPPPHSCGGR